jgi:outer membrane biosynthesis protein TonB
MATSLKTQLASKGIKITLKNKTTGEQMKFNFPQGVKTIPIHMTVDSYSIYGHAMLVDHPIERVGDPDLMLVLVNDEMKKEFEKHQKPAPEEKKPAPEEKKPAPEEKKPEENKPAPEEPKSIPEEKPLEPPVVDIPVEQPVSSTTPVAPAAPKPQGRKNR